MQRDDVRLRQELVKGDELGPVRRHCQHRVADQNSRPESQNAADHGAPDRARPDDSDGGADEVVGCDAAGTIPSVFPQGAIVLDETAHQGEHQRQRVVGDRLLVRSRRRGDEDSGPGGRGDIDGIDADARAGDHFQARAGFEDIG